MAMVSAGDKVTPLSVKGYKVSAAGSTTKSIIYDTSQSLLNVYDYFQSGSSLVWDVESNTLGWLLSRTMLLHSDGLNHQVGLDLDII